MALLEGADGCRRKHRSCLPPPPSTATTELLDSLRMVSELKQYFSPQAIRSYVISETRSAADVLIAGLAGGVERGAGGGVG